MRTRSIQTWQLSKLRSSFTLDARSLCPLTLPEVSAFQSSTILDASVPTVLVTSALQTPTTKLDAPASQTLLEMPAKTIITSLDSSSTSTTLDVPSLQSTGDALDSTMLATSALPIMLVHPETITLIAQAILQRWPRSTIRLLYFLPTNFQEPEYLSAIGTPSSTAFGPHDPGPSIAPAVCIFTAFTIFTFSAIANYAVTDFLRTPPRSPSTVYIIS
jgi:hypothetical protein